MKKKNYGFTLVELLAVIVVLGIIMAVAGTSVLKIRKNSNIETAKKLEKTLTDLGPNIYSYEMMKEAKLLPGEEDGNFHYNYQNIESTDEELSAMDVDTRKMYQGYSLLVTVKQLKEAGYLNSENLKIGNESCAGFIRVYKTNDGPYFEGNICCPGIYSTNKGAGAVEDNCNWYDKSNDVSSIHSYTPTYTDAGETKARQGWVTTLTK